MKIRVFKNKTTAKAAIKRQGICGIPHEFVNHCSAAGTGIVVRFKVDNSQDYHELQDRGFLTFYS